MASLAVDRTGVPRNPFLAEGFQRFHRLRLLLFTRSQDRELRNTVALPGTIRRFVSPPVAVSTGQPPFSWSKNAADGVAPTRGNPVTNPLRFWISTTDVLTAGNQRSNPMLRPAVPPSVSAPAPPLVLAGNVQNRPVLRQRVPSFGSRIPSLNTVTPGDLRG